MLIKFYNDTGSALFGASSTDVTPFRLTGAEGFSAPDKTFTKVGFAGMPGQVTSQTQVNARVITLSGDFLLNSASVRAYEKLLCILDSEGWLCVYSDGKKRKIKAVCSDFAEGERNGEFVSFAVQFTCDNPFFEDFEPVKKYIFKRTGCIDSEFMLPGVFTDRISKGDILYGGSAKSEPVICIRNPEETKARTSDGIEIRNNTHGECIKLMYVPKKGEEITVDIAERKIYNDSGENLLRYISDDTYLDEFALYPGKNEIEVILNGTYGELTVACTFSNKYIEAVYG